MTLALDHHQADTAVQRRMLRLTLRQHRLGLTLLAVALLLPSLAVMHWLRTGEYALTQLPPALYGKASPNSYWDTHWDHVAGFDNGLYDLVYAADAVCLLLLFPVTSMVRRDLATRVHVTLWTQGASPTQWLLAKVAVLAAVTVACFGTVTALAWVLLRWATGRQVVFDTTHDAWLLRNVGPSMVTTALIFVCLGALFAVVPGSLPTRILSRLGLLVALAGLDFIARDLFSGTAGLSRTLVTDRFSGTSLSKSVLTGINSTDYWQGQLITCTYDLAIAAGALLLALHLLRRRTADRAG
ncbi:hypothetical protein [Streptacidiphilus cavernicola]|uniref:ABC transporter permease n=1 Tax=Streptacidiphilus cavernicola TaxID=3342716 RepID=A0ABV6VXA8_9ACTN